jgi:hypothetical protein
MKPRLRILMMAGLAAIVAYLLAPPDGSAAMTVSSPALMLVTSILYLPIVLIPAAVLPTRILTQRLTFRTCGEILIRVVLPALLIAGAETFALSSLDGEGGVIFSFQLAMTFGTMVTLLFITQLVMVLVRNNASAAQQPVAAVGSR